MAEYQNNHHVPQLILRRYDERLNVYNLATEELLINKRIEKCFSKKNIYPEWVEKMLQKVEGPFANLLNNKLLNAKNYITLHRNDLYLIKKFLIIEQLRSLASIECENNVFENEGRGFDEVKLPNETYKDYIFRTMKVIIDCNNENDILRHSERTYQAYKWFMLYKFCYLTFWDSEKCGEDFLITDIGMTCEHETSKFLFQHFGFNEELLKSGYVISKLNNGYRYQEMLAKLAHVQANYYMFSISETRMIGLINPFYRLYFDDNVGEKPDIWPTKLSMDALTANSVNYKKSYDMFVEYSADDEYTYKIKDLELDDVLVINLMMLDRVDEIVGYVNSSKILRSLAVYSYGKQSRKDYTGLVNKLIDLGYNIPKNNKYSEQYDRISRIDYVNKDYQYMKLFIENLRRKGIKTEEEVKPIIFFLEKLINGEIIIQK